ncbi:hypothetical protein QUF88_18040 [Bacillus sp. DX1.1]|uniref:hypothetical protein n=1 Tax=unclassified Bacillus (in: firmicutes) TaxID=185979 RepID=UPI0025708435|nr:MULTISPECIES: hypothetical protein [unclassified Bacillus (in: firmicutes)]MDM5155618.1 hypothetical protein [Bacillus sp. DX1.1]WJE79924.1 hypothetical protein QRE67_15570 [Bacillus sp. DX3.1]
MEKNKQGQRILFCFIVIGLCLVAAIGITIGVFFTKEKIGEHLQEKKENRTYKEPPPPSKGGGELTELEPTRKGKWDFSEDKNKYKIKKGKFDGNKKTVIQKLKEAIENFTLIIKNNQLTIFGVVLMLTIILFLVFRRMQKKKQLPNIQLTEKMEIQESEEDVQDTNYIPPLPADEVRAMLVNWERTLPTFAKRRIYETMQQWFSRIQKNDDIITIYEKVRYGELAVSSDELQIMQRWIKENEKRVHEK